MKKVLNLLLIIIVSVFVVGITNVNAYVLEPNSVTINVPENKVIKINSTEVGTGNYDGNYIIGTYMFSYNNTNDSYDGILRAKHIMLASKSIESNSLDDMKIYYVKGKALVDAFTGENIPDYNINITNLNIVEVEANIVDDSIPTPFLYNPPMGISGGHGIYYLDENHKETNTSLAAEVEGEVDFIELASSKKEKGYYKPNYVSKQIIPVSSDYTDVILFAAMNYGESEYFKARACRMVNDSTENFVCGDWSNTLFLKQEVDEVEYTGMGNEQPDGMYESYMNSDRVYIELYGSKVNSTSGYKLLETKKSQYSSGYYIFGSNGVKESGPYTEEYINEHYESLPYCDDIGYEEREAEYTRCYDYMFNNYVKFDYRLGDNQYRSLSARAYVINSNGDKVYGPMSDLILFANPVDTSSEYTIELDNSQDTCWLYDGYLNYCHIDIDGLYKNGEKVSDSRYNVVEIYAQVAGSDEPMEYVDVLDEDDDIRIYTDESPFDNLVPRTYNQLMVAAKAKVFTSEGVYYTAFGNAVNMKTFLDNDW